MNLMRLSAGGQPLCHLPEAWAVAERAPTLKGRLGRPIRYRRVYPLARIIREGAKRYMRGASLRDLAEWAPTTELREVNSWRPADGPLVVAQHTDEPEGRGTPQAV
jgi:hypothetical protein